MSGLKNRLAAAIRRDGPLSIADYMTVCLTDPENGYYTNAQAIGRQGDFITAPEISQVFGELIGLFLADYWQRSGAPGRICLAELGPGRGTLMADLLRAARLVPGFFQALEVHLVEVSPRLAAEQAERLAESGKQPVWQPDIASLPQGLPLFVVANEFFDALPIRQFEKTAEGWFERLVGLDEAGTGLATCLSGEPAPDIPPHADSAPLGAIVETAEAASAVSQALAARISQDGGIALYIDYGHAGTALGDTFQAVRAHGFADPLAEPGLADLTAHVDFGALAASAVGAAGAGAVIWGPIGQGSFLGRLGLRQRVLSLGAGKPPETVRALEAAAARLAAPDRMGVLFKCLVVSRQGGPVPAGFEPADTAPALEPQLGGTR